MMRYLLSIFILFLLSSAATAQTSSKVENWQVFAPVADEFSVEAPLKLDQRGENGSRFSRSFTGSVNGVHLFIFSDPIKKETDQDPRYLAMVRGVLPQIGQSADIVAPEGSGTHSVSFRDKFGYWHNLITLQTETRFYIAQTMALDEKSEVSSRFIKSFTLSQRAQIVEQLEAAPERTEDKWANRPSNRGLGNGSGSGQRPVDLGAVPIPPPLRLDANLAKSLKILNKPRPGYNDIARVYGIQGTVILEVEFLESGAIGFVKSITQLPLGLTQTAIDAAKRITFEPAALDGAPVSVTRKIEYSYSIY